MNRSAVAMAMAMGCAAHTTMAWARGCFETNHVVGHERCARFEFPDDEHRASIAIDVAIGVRAVPLGGLVFPGTAFSFGSTPTDFTVTGAQLGGGTAAIVGPELTVRGFVAPWAYLGGRLGLGVAHLDERVFAGPSGLIVDTGDVYAVGGAVVAGVRLAASRWFSFRLESAGGLRAVFISPSVTLGESVDLPNATVVLPYLDAIAVIDVFALPWFSTGLSGGVTFAPDPMPIGGLVFSFHTRSWGGAFVR